MEAIRIATKAEVEQFGLQDKLDITPNSTVVAYPSGDKTPDFAVIRTVTELDPVIFAESTDNRRKAVFLWGIETALGLMGVSEYYFNVPADQEDYHKILEKMGAGRTSPQPDYRYKKVLR